MTMWGDSGLFLVLRTEAPNHLSRLPSAAPAAGEADDPQGAITLIRNQVIEFHVCPNGLLTDVALGGLDHQHGTRRRRGVRRGINAKSNPNRDETDGREGENPGQCVPHKLLPSVRGGDGTPATGEKPEEKCEGGATGGYHQDPDIHRG